MHVARQRRNEMHGGWRLIGPASRSALARASRSVQRQASPRRGRAYRISRLKRDTGAAIEAAPASHT
jgi:hypothetical protein